MLTPCSPPTPCGAISFGNGEASNLDTGEGSMEAVYFGTNNASAKGWCGGGASC